MAARARTQGQGHRVPATLERDRGLWTTGQVATALGVSPVTLRTWDARYGLGPTQRPSGRHRRYSDHDVQRLRTLQHLITSGMPTREAAELCRSRHRPPADDLVAAALRFDSDTLISLLDEQITTHGVADTWQQLCCPALNVLGGPDSPIVDTHIDVIHLLSWAIAAALHRLRTPPAPQTPAALLACTENERHTLPLEALRAALAARGITARLLGAAVPGGAILEALHRTPTPPAAVVLWTHTPTNASEALPLADMTDLWTPTGSVDSRSVV
jgi:DNA-binding transcriptional MerR regulator